ncbi:MAG: hypothetical protein PHC53_01735 [Patescibacteria group bacterium]|nr:hypothetical protein [Patescibacteria group bacterium]
MVEHESLAAKLRKEFDRLQITDETTRNALTTELNQIAILLIESCPHDPTEVKM